MTDITFTGGDADGVAWLSEPYPDWNKLGGTEPDECGEWLCTGSKNSYFDFKDTKYSTGHPLAGFGGAW